jgi:hypothetical protein
MDGNVFKTQIRFLLHLLSINSWRQNVLIVDANFQYFVMKK